MKKLVYLAAVGAMALAACQPQNGYKVSGTIPGLNDGDTVLLQKLEENREWTAIDTAVISNGEFVFKGQTDTTEVRFVTFNKEGRTGAAPIFLEKGNIVVTFNEEGKATISGTENNDIYNTFNIQSDSIYGVAIALNEKLSTDTTLTDEEKEAKEAELDELVNNMRVQLPLNTIKANIDKPVGFFLLASRYSYFDLATLEELSASIPAQYADSKEVAAINDYIAALRRSSVGQKYTDFELQTPEGETVKLSDFVSQNKVTLIDFWASWCGPCRAEMPNVVKAYEAYNKKGFGIVGVSLDNNVDAWKAAIETLKITWPQMSDLQGWKNAAAQLYAIHSIPATFLIDENGIIIEKDLRGDKLAEKLAEILK
jgi:peroxiredoxin